MYRLNLKVGIVIVAQQANHIIVIADTQAHLGEYLKIASYVSCNNQNCQFEVWWPRAGMQRLCIMTH